MFSKNASLMFSASSAMAAIIAAMSPIPSFGPRARGAAKRRNTTTAHKRHGAREINRRLRQVANDQLTHSNGLRTAEELGLASPVAKPARKPRVRKAA